MRKVVAALACVVVLTGCASASSTMLSDDTALISAEGNGASDRDKVVRDVLAEAARLTSANGFRYFVVLTADDLSQTVTVRIPGRILYNQPPRSGEALNAYAGRAYATGGSTYQTPDRIEEGVRGAMENFIGLYRGGVIEPAEGVFDAMAMRAAAATR
jgi:hypothetical protein